MDNEKRLLVADRQELGRVLVGLLTAIADELEDPRLVPAELREVVLTHARQLAEAVGIEPPEPHHQGDTP